MKRSEVYKYIEEELAEFIQIYNKASEKAKPYKIKLKAMGILDMLEGFGMLPPGINENGDGESFDYVWEPEDES